MFKILNPSEFEKIAQEKKFECKEIFKLCLDLKNSPNKFFKEGENQTIFDIFSMEFLSKVMQLPVSEIEKLKKDLGF